MQYRIAEIATQQNIHTATQLARMCGVSEAIVIDLWRNRTINPTLATLEKIAAVLGVQVSELLKEEVQQ